MPEWELPAWLVTVLIAAIPVTGVVVAAVLTYRAKVAETTLLAEQSAATAAATLIDQLQEELEGYRKAADRRATAQDERMNRLEQHSDGYRTYAHELRAHIFDGLGLPVPEWPAGLPR